MAQKKNFEKVNPYEAVTRRIVLSLAQGDIPWRKPWSSPYSGDIINYVSRTPYRGVNRILLGRKGEWLTFAQALAAKGNVKKGVKGVPRIVYNKYVPKDRKDEYDALVAAGEPAEHLKKTFASIGYVFHIDDCEGIESKITTVEHHDAVNPTDKADAVIGKFRSVTVTAEETDEVKISGASVTLPRKEQFRTDEEWYNAVFAAMISATAAQCGRPLPGDKNYDSTKEGLVVEMGASMVLATVGLERKEASENTTAKCAEWIEAFNRDLRLVVGAAAAAEKAAKHILEPLYGKVDAPAGSEAEEEIEDL